MAFEFGQFNEFGDSVTAGDPVIMAVAKAISLGAFVGKFYESMVAPETTLTQKVFEVYSRTKTSRNGVIGATAWGATGASGLSMTAAGMKGLTIGHVLKVDNEALIIKAVNRAANTIDVYARGAGGTTAAAHTAGAAFTVIGFAGCDTDLKNVEGMTETTNVWENYVQTVFEVVDWTKHAALVRKGLSSANAVAVILKEAELRLAEILSTMSINGLKQKATDGTDRYMSAGLLSQLRDTNGGKRTALTYNVNGDLTESKINDSLKLVFDLGGNPNTMWMNPTCKKFINYLNACNSNLAIVANKSDHTAGGQYVTHYDYEGNVLAIRIDRDIPPDCIAVVNQGKCKKGWLVDDGLRMVDEPAASSREMRKSLQGSLGFMIEDVGTEHILLTGITGGPTERVYKTQAAS